MIKPTMERIICFTLTQTERNKHCLYLLFSSRISNTVLHTHTHSSLLVYLIDSKQCRTQNPQYLSMSVSREESRKPLANGLLSIFSLVIWETHSRRVETVIVSPFFKFTLQFVFVFSQSSSQSVRFMFPPAAWLSSL